MLNLIISLVSIGAGIYLIKNENYQWGIGLILAPLGFLAKKSTKKMAEPVSKSHADEFEKYLKNKDFGWFFRKSSIAGMFERLNNSEQIEFLNELKSIDRNQENIMQLIENKSKELNSKIKNAS